MKKFKNSIRQLRLFDFVSKKISRQIKIHRSLQLRAFRGNKWTNNKKKRRKKLKKKNEKKREIHWSSRLYIYHLESISITAKRIDVWRSTNGELAVERGNTVSRDIRNCTRKRARREGRKASGAVESERIAIVIGSTLVREAAGSLLGRFCIKSGN